MSLLPLVPGAAAAVAVLAVAWTLRPLGRSGAAVPVLPRPSNPPARRLLTALLAAVVALPVVPVLAPVAGLAVWVGSIVRLRRRRARDHRLVLRELPEAIDLLSLAVAAGANVPAAVHEAADRVEGRLGLALRDVRRQIELGRRCADVLEELPRLVGDDIRPLVAVLTSSERYGTPLQASLDRLTAELRAERRRRSEAAARRVPVRLLFPLVCCILPAFALLTVVPLLAGSLGALRP
jgi:tight adherence protein C